MKGIVLRRLVSFTEQVEARRKVVVCITATKRIHFRNLRIPTIGTKKTYP